MTKALPFNVLLVEDTADIATLMQINLEGMGLTVHHANTGPRAADYLSQNRPDLILLDLNLPGMNGWQVLEQAKKHHGEHRIRVIITTASDDASNRLVGKLQYVDRYLTKPFTPSQLTEAVRSVLELDKL